MKEFIRFNVADRQLFEDYLNHMSEKGYAFKGIDGISVSFKKSDTRKFYYVDLYEKKPNHHIDYKKEERQKQIDLYEEMGLKFIHVFHHFMIYESDKKVHLHSDLKIEEKLIKETQHRIFGGEFSSKQFIIYGLVSIFSFLAIAWGEQLSYLWICPLSVLFLISVILMYRKLKSCESKIEKSFKDAKLLAISQIYAISLLFVSTSLTFILTSSNIIDGLIKYVKLFGFTLALFVVNVVFGKYDSNKEVKRTLIFVICSILVIGVIYFL